MIFFSLTKIFQCKPKPEPPLYSGGMIVNPEFNDGLKGWAAVGNAKIEIAKSPDGNTYIVASNRLAEADGVSQTVNLESDKYYTVSGTYFDAVQFNYEE